jgi:Fe-S oxidoreductase
MGIGMSLLEGRIDFSEKLLDVVYNCQMCGACDVSCKYAMDMEVLAPMAELRVRCVETGHSLPALDAVVEGLRNNGEMVPGAATGREEWARGQDAKNVVEETAEVLFHAGCRTCADAGLQKIARTGLALLKKAGVDVGTFGGQETCCGGRALSMGYRDDFLRQAERNTAAFRKSGAGILVTGCAECAHAFRVAYPKAGFSSGLRVLHITEYLDELIKTGRLEVKKNVPMKVTYQDPCHLGRLGEPYVPWSGKEIPGHIRLFDPPKEFCRGTCGVYGPPREVLESIPGVELLEMDRTREYAWCCGAGGGVRESNAEFSGWTAAKRLEEAAGTGAEAIVTACPGCRQNLAETAAQNDSRLQVLDVVEILENAV